MFIAKRNEDALFSERISHFNQVSPTGSVTDKPFLSPFQLHWCFCEALNRAYSFRLGLY